MVRTRDSTTVVNYVSKTSEKWQVCLTCMNQDHRTQSYNHRLINPPCYKTYHALPRCCQERVTNNATYSIRPFYSDKTTFYRQTLMYKVKSFPRLEGPLCGTNLHFCSPRLDTSWSCRTTEKRPEHCVVCLFIPVYSYVFAGTHEPTNGRWHAELALVHSSCGRDLNLGSRDHMSCTLPHSH